MKSSATFLVTLFMIFFVLNNVSCASPEEWINALLIDSPNTPFCADSIKRCEKEKDVDAFRGCYNKRVARGCERH
ncbi:hypothetical protein AB4K20DRAFT_1914453 [Rhizopus microsporus]|uniref:Uncharacterized protein n=1 Tax=Rhizopus microsporus TaxID=58291 RepID=A0A1X0RUR9_RHIZD|nr:hypothetical protein BCV71DRAFT_228492 [Rhizopus microsporus]